MWWLGQLTPPSEVSRNLYASLPFPLQIREHPYNLVVCLQIEEQHLYTDRKRVPYHQHKLTFLLLRQHPTRKAPRQIKHKKQRRSEEHTSELQSRFDLVCRLLLE